jgi:hypothetical protein
VRVVKRVLGFARSPLVRWAFLAVALVLAVYAVWANWDELVDAARQLSVGTLALALVASAVYVALTMLSWRRILTDLGSRLPLLSAAALFGVSQIGKYVPGGVWNVVAAAELGADHKIPRRRSVAAMGVAVLVSLVSGVVVGCLGLALSPGDARDRWGWIVWLAPVLLVLLVPAVLNRIVAGVLRLARREPLTEPLTTRGLGASVLWSLAAWLVAGLQVWTLATALGMDATPRTFALALGGYALAWVVGFLVVFVPAGAGAREAVLVAVLSGSLTQGAVLVVVLVSRVLLTVIDLAAAGFGLIVARREARERQLAEAAAAPKDGGTP